MSPVILVGGRSCQKVEPRRAPEDSKKCEGKGDPPNRVSVMGKPTNQMSTQPYGHRASNGLDVWQVLKSQLHIPNCNQPHLIFRRGELPTFHHIFAPSLPFCFSLSVGPGLLEEFHVRQLAWRPSGSGCVSAQPLMRHKGHTHSGHPLMQQPLMKQDMVRLWRAFHLQEVGDLRELGWRSEHVVQSLDENKAPL